MLFSALSGLGNAQGMGPNALQRTVHTGDYSRRIWRLLLKTTTVAELVSPFPATIL